jgi:hypothetical protein
VQTGWLPNYGSNDGALFFPFTEADYRDYRPQLNSLHLLLTGKALYGPQPAWEDAIWWNADRWKQPLYPVLTPAFGWTVFPDGGFAVLREAEGFSFIRCGSHKDRPAQADNLHRDIWWNGVNYLFDAGSYLYNASAEMLSWFMGTKGHNTVQLGDADQMLKGPRFIWFNWSQAEDLQVGETAEYFSFSGTIRAYAHLGEGIRHTRKIKKFRNRAEWEVEDSIVNLPANQVIHQLWHTGAHAVHLSAVNSRGEVLTCREEQGWVSDYYGVKEPANYKVFTTEDSLIITRITI